MCFFDQMETDRTAGTLLSDKKMYFFFQRISREHLYGLFYAISNRADFIGNRNKYLILYKLENKNDYP